MRKLESILAERAHLDADDRDLRSRTDAKEERVAVEDTLSELGEALVACKPQWLEKLSLSDRLIDAISDARLIKSPIAKNRQLRIVRRELRDSDWQRVQTLLGELREHGSLLSDVSRPTLPSSDEALWVARLLQQGDPAIADLVEHYPQADRSQLRQLLRNVSKAPADKRAKPEQKLREAVQALVQSQLANLPDFD